MISIIIPVYNQAKHLNNCLNSIKRQTYHDYEIIIIDDGSGDDAETVAKKYQEDFGQKLSYFRQENRGANAARNRGVGLAKGDYLIFCDADIVMKPEMLKLMLETLEKQPGASFCYSSFVWGGKKFRLWPYDAAKLKKIPYINTASLIRTEHFPEHWDESIRRFQDWDLWLTMAERGRVGIWLDKTLYRVNISGTQTMSRWLPRLAYKLLPFLPAVKKYNQAKEIIIKKHHLLPP